MAEIKVVKIKTSKRQNYIGIITRSATMTKKSRSYRDDLLKSLTDPDEAKEYLNAALEDENPEVFLLALRDIVDAHTSMSRLAQATNRNRESLYKTLSEKGNPQLSSIRSILSNLGFKLTVDVS